MQRFKIGVRSVAGARWAAVALLATAVAGPAYGNTTLGRAMAVLEKKGIYAEDSFYACMLDAYYQGLSIEQATEQCAIQLIEDDQKGLGEKDEGFGFGPLDPGKEKFFDPYAITGACSGGDPGISGETGHADYGNGWGYYSWGDGEGKKGLSQADAKAAKDAAIAAAREALNAWEQADKKFREAIIADEKARREAEDKKAREAAKAATNAAIEAKKKWIEAQKKAKEDPNKKEPEKKEPEKQDPEKQDPEKKDPEKKDPEKKAPEKKDPKKKDPHRTEDQTPCDEALQGAREILRECHRTGWKTYECQQLQAGMNNCPDPAQIYVDPEQGYACADTIDGEALKEAWTSACEQLQRGVDPDTNPCKQPRVDNPGRFIQEDPQMLCDDPAARYEGGSETCVATFVLARPYGEPDLRALLVVGLNKFGGPTVVLPDRFPPPVPGPGGPKD